MDLHGTHFYSPVGILTSIMIISVDPYIISGLVIAISGVIDRRVLTSGNSKVAALPPSWLRLHGIKPGDRVDLVYGSVVMVVPKGIRIDAEVLRREISLIASLAGARRESKPGEGECR